MSALTCYCGEREFANRRCWIHLPPAIRNVYVLGGRLSDTEEAEVPSAFHLAFSNNTGRAAMATVNVPHRATIWLQNMADIQYKLKRPGLSPDKRRVLEAKLQELTKKLDQN